MKKTGKNKKKLTHSKNLKMFYENTILSSKDVNQNITNSGKCLDQQKID